jgi:hypothetical protein
MKNWVGEQWCKNWGNAIGRRWFLWGAAAAVVSALWVPAFAETLPSYVRISQTQWMEFQNHFGDMWSEYQELFPGHDYQQFILFLQKIWKEKPDGIVWSNTYALKNSIQTFNISEKLYWESIWYVWHNEIDSFRRFFWVWEWGEKTVIQKIISVQEELVLNDIDGILWPQTLEEIYSGYYTRNNDFDTQYKSNIAKKLTEWERTKPKPNAFSAKHLFGTGDLEKMENIPWTYIAKWLQHLPQEWEKNNLYLETWEDGLSYVRLYDSAGKLYVAGYISPGSLDRKTPQKAPFQTNKTDLYHASSSYNDASMYAATGLHNSLYWIHSSRDEIDGTPHSHGCARTGLWYAQAIHDYVKDHGPITVHMTNLY